MTDLQKPRIKKELAVAAYSAENRWISMDATLDAIQEYAEFGRVSSHPFLPEYYTLQVDARYDFDEVLGWILAHGAAT